ncbi:MAG: glycosyltransferase family 4 protein [Candidatus Omnitrophica bacterium]|nr:glycosyltransferase family 4 protein [Candidatus Omnitrophota bacterium]
MNLLVFCYEFPPIGGGAGRALFQLSRRWVTAGHEVTVVTTRWDGLLAEEIVDGIRVIRLKCGRKEKSRGRIIEMLVYMVRSFLEAGCWIKKTQPDLCVAFMTVPGGLAPLWIKKRFGVHFVTFLRGGDVPGFDPVRLKGYHCMTCKMILHVWEQSRVVIANSHGLARLAHDSCPHLNIPVIPNGVEIDSQSDALRTRAPNSRLKCLFAGRLADSQKNVSLLLSALAPLEWAELEIIGDGPDRRYLAEMAIKLGMDHRVFFRGWKSTSELKAHLRLADLYISASRWEGMPNACLEAMAEGLPLVLSRVAGHEDLVEEGRNGFLFDPNVSTTLAVILNRFEKNVDLSLRMGFESRRIASERFRWEDSAVRCLEIFEECRNVS